MTRSMMKRLLSLLLCIAIILGTAAFAENIPTEEDQKETVQTNEVVYAPLRYYTNNSDDVRKMQARLKELGYFNTGISGGYYSATADAVAAFQRMAGLEVNRKLASSEMLALLYSDEAPASNGKPLTPTAEPTPVPVGVLTYGMNDNDEVRRAQKRLKELGYFSNSTTGNFYEDTRKAFEAFQAKMGLQVSGKIINQETLDMLYSDAALAANATASPTPGPSATPAPAPTAMPEATPRPALCYGQTSEAVREMQQRLIELKYLRAGATGSYWQATVTAVEAFQQAAGLPVNGRIADEATLELLFSDDAPVKPGEEEQDPETADLNFGQSGKAEIRRMQDRLRELGYFSEPSTGGYYQSTADAVAAFQEAAGFPVNGNVASAEMLKALYAENAPVCGMPPVQATPQPTDMGIPMPDPTATPEPTATPKPTATPEPTATPRPKYITLKYGMDGSDEVYALQEKLYELGYLTVSPTGGYWSMTVQAVKLFLQDHGMEGDGKTATYEMQELLFETELGDGGDDAVIYETLTYGMKNSSAVKAMQTRLRALGFFEESPTGNYFDVTASAVAAFQTAAGLTVDKKTASPGMQTLLFSADAPTADGGRLPGEDEGAEGDGTGEENGDGVDEEVVGPTLNTDYTPLTYGMQNSSEVRAMQKKLKERGFFSGSATGGYFSETKKAVAAFQTYAKLPVNGSEASALMLGYLFYEGDLDTLIAVNGPVSPEEGDGTTGGENDDGSGAVQYDPEKYKDADVNAMLYKGCTGRQVELLIMRLSELGYLEDSDPTEYDSNVSAAVKWFQNTNLLDADGVAGPKTLKVLYSEKAISADDSMKDNAIAAPPEVEGEPIEVSIGSVLNVDWFSDAGVPYYNRRSGQLSDGTVVILTDVSTGLSFRARRSGGYNHADMEPLTAYDTWVMFQIYNQDWAWTRHAVYVTLPSGVTLAGSMNGMPHGSSSITDNNFEGHFCVHFLNSRTHGSDKVDPDHQAAVKRAAGR